MISEALLEKLQYLTWDERRALHYLSAIADHANYVYHPEGRSVAMLIADALDCHASTAYDIIRELRIFGFVITEPHPLSLRRRRNHGYCVHIMVDRDVLSSDLALSILRYPPRAERWLGFDPLRQAREKNIYRPQTQ